MAAILPGGTHRLGVATIMAFAVPSWSIPTTSDEISRETSQLVSAAKELTGLYSDAKGAYDVGTKLLQAIGWIKTDPTVSQQITDLESRENQGFAGAIWTVDSITVQGLLANLQTARDELTTGTPIVQGQNPEFWSAQAVNYFADTNNYPDASHSTNGVFYRQWTDADQTLLNLLNQNTGGMYSKADFDPQSATTNLVYDWRMGVPALMTAIAMRLQIVTAMDPNFRTDGKYSEFFLRYRMALQWHYSGTQ